MCMNVLPCSNPPPPPYDMYPHNLSTEQKLTEIHNFLSIKQVPDLYYDARHYFSVNIESTIE